MLRSVAASFALVVLFLVSAGPGFAQTPPAPPGTLDNDPRDLLKSIQALGLASSTNLITVYYAPEHEAKALRLRALVEQAMAFYDRSLGVRGELHLAVLTRPQWEKVITAQPYGIPGVAGEPPVAFLPATDDGLAATDALSIRAGVSPETVRLIEAASGSYEDASRRYVDLVGLHELGHTYTNRFGIRVPSRWAGEMLATYFAYAHLRAHEPKQAEVWDGILRAYRDAVRPKHTTLADFERLYFGVGAQNYIWYQGQFQQMVRRVYEAQGLDFLRAVREAFPAGETGTLTPEETLRRFEKIYPGFEAWAMALAPAAPQPPATPMTPSEPHEKLAMFIGTWTMDVFPPQAQMRESCDWLGSGRRHVVCHSRWETDRGRREGLSIFSYRASDKAYVYQGFRAGGGTQTLTGKATPDGGWEFTGDEGSGPSRLQTLVRISARRPDGTFRFTERTARGDAPWSDDAVAIYSAAK